jgi:hypothetical protein
MRRSYDAHPTLILSRFRTSDAHATLSNCPGSGRATLMRRSQIVPVPDERRSCDAQIVPVPDERRSCDAQIVPVPDERDACATLIMYSKFTKAKSWPASPLNISLLSPFRVSDNIIPFFYQHIPFL